MWRAEAGVTDGPPVGRQGMVAELEGVVAAGGAAALVGPMGVGKTTVVRFVADRMAENGRPVLWLQGTPGTRDLPFGTAAPTLARFDGTAGASGDVGRRLTEALTPDDAVCVLDDLQWMDDQTLGVVHHLLAAPEHPAALATVRAGERVSPAGTQLLRLPVLSEVAVDALDEAATEDLVTRFLGAPPDRMLLRELLRVGQGNPLFVTELLAASRADDTLVFEHGLWCLRGALAPSLILSEVVSGRFDGLASPTLRAAELLAVAEHLDLEMADAVCGGAELADLERNGLLIEGGTAADGHVRLAHPIHAEVLLRRMGRLTQRTHRRTLASALGQRWSAESADAGGRIDGRGDSGGADGSNGRGDPSGRRDPSDPGGRRDADALRVARWSLDAGDPVDPRLALAAARAANATHDLVTAETLARLAWEQAPSAQAGNLLVEVVHLQRRFDEARALVQEVAATIQDDRERATVVTLDAVGLFHGGRDIDGALELVTNARASLIDDEARRALHITEVYLHMMSERFGGLDGAIATLEADYPAHSTPAMRQLVAGAHIIRGRTDAALELLARPVLSDEDLFLSSEDISAMADGFRALALIRAGRVLEGEGIARATHPRCLDLGAPRARAAASYGLAMALLLQGRAAEAARWAADAVVAQEGELAPNGLLMARALGLEAAIEMGDPERIEVERTALAELTDTHERLFAAIGCRAEATAVVLVDGELELGLGVLCDAAERYVHTGAPDFALDLAFRAVVLGADPARVADVAARTATAAPPLGGLRARAIGALVTDDVDELDAVGTALADLGCRVDARFVLAAAATAAARGGATKRSADLRYRSEALTLGGHEPPAPTEAAAGRAGVDGGGAGAAGRTGAAGRIKTDGGSAERAGSERGHPEAELLDPGRWALLTDREDEVCRLAAQGLASKAIAAQLHISRRTVDHALQRAYAKLGIAGRSELVGRDLPVRVPAPSEPAS